MLIVNEIFELGKTIEWFEAIKDSQSRLDLMIESDSSRPIGQISLVNIDHQHKTAEIILVIGDKDYWGKGVMFEAESLLIQWAFEKRGIEKVWAQTRSENVASLITMKKLGFKIQGSLGKEKILAGQRFDIIHLDLLPQDFKPANCTKCP